MYFRGLWTQLQLWGDVTGPKIISFFLVPGSSGWSQPECGIFLPQNLGGFDPAKANKTWGKARWGHLGKLASWHLGDLHHSSLPPSGLGGGKVQSYATAIFTTREASLRLTPTQRHTHTGRVDRVTEKLGQTTASPDVNCGNQYISTCIKPIWIRPYIYIFGAKNIIIDTST